MKLQIKNISTAIKDIHIKRLLVIMVLWMIFMGIFRFDKFYTLINFQTMAAQFPEFGLMALGIMLCMISGGIDLSVVGVANFVAIASGQLLKIIAGGAGELNGFEILLVMLFGMAIGLAAGFFNGILVSKVKIPPILATLGSYELFRGIAIILTGGKAVSGLPIKYAETIAGKLFGLIPVQLLFFAAVVLILSYLLNRTTYGIKLYMLGTNATAAMFSGHRTERVLIQTYALSGICAALGGLIMLANYNSARADYGAVYTLQCVLIVVLGGVNPMGGKGRISGTVLAICVLQMLSSGINRFPEISSFYIPLFWGGVLLLVMVLNYYRENKQSQGGHKKAVISKYRIWVRKSG
ncbi:MAG TPA: ABC transporter permease [Clostridiales bacterium]|nr:ABC transporter permease [Clostridiales bacterium]